MAEIIWSPEALLDLEEVIDFISKDSLYYTELTIETIIARTETLIAQPFQGRMIPEFQNPMRREVFEYRFRIMYSISALPNVEILRIFHTSRDLKER